MPNKVIIIDYGSQVTQLIARRVREAGIYSEIHPCTVKASEVAAMKPQAIILSGGPASVGSKDAPVLDRGFFELEPYWAYGFTPPEKERRGKAPRRRIHSSCQSGSSALPS